MKKRLLAVLAVAVMLFAFAGCGGKDLSGSPYVGTWTATTASYSGVEMSVESILGGDMSFVLEDNGKCTMTIAGEEETGKWDETDNGFSIENEIEAVVDGDSATVDYEGVTLKFEKE